MSNLWKVNAPHKSVSEFYAGFGAKILGSVQWIRLLRDCAIEDGPVLDIRFGGSIALGRDGTIRSGAILVLYGGKITIGD